MRKIAAHYIYPISSPPIKYGILTIDDDGTVLDLSQSSDEFKESASVEFYNGIIVPGFVNAHCHLELSHMQGFMQKNIGMGNFCKAVSTYRNNPSEDEKQRCMAVLDEQMLSEGIVAVGDISNTELSFLVKQNSSIYYHTFIECLGFGDHKADTIIENAIKVKNTAIKKGLTATITPHASYSMSEKLFSKTLELAKKDGIMSIHNQESREEMELFKTGESNLRKVFENFGFDENILIYKNPLDRLLKYLMPLNLLLIHNVYTTLRDIERVIAKNPDTTWVLCPNSNLYIENSLPPAEMFYRAGINVAIGTDSLASNNNLSILEEIKTLTTNYPAIPLQTLLYWATMGGAKALQKDNILGSFTIGKRPGITLIEGVNYNNMTLTNNSKSTNLLHNGCNKLYN